MLTTKSTKRYGRKEAAAPTAEETAKLEAAAKAAKDAADKKAADGKQNNDLTIDELTNVIAGQIEAQLKKAFPEQAKSFEESVKKIFAEELARQTADSKTLDKAGIEALVQTVSQKAIDGVRKEKRHFNDPADADKGGHNQGKSRIELGDYSMRSGNLPLHYKQLLNCLMRKNPNDGIDEADLERGQKLEDQMWQGMKSEGVKALTREGTGTGAEFIPRSLSSELYRRLYLESMLAQQFLGSEVEMPTDSYDFPLQTTDPTFYLNTTENTESDASEVGSANFTLTSKKLMAKVKMSYELDEDSIIPILPLVQERLGKSGARVLEDLLINGDTTSSHMDSDVTAANSALKAWKGLRKLALAGNIKSDLTSGGLSRANLLAMIKLMGKYGVNTNELLWITGVKGWNALLNLDEVALAYARGQAGTYTQGGPPPAPWGGSIIVSEKVRENLNASGVYDGSTVTKGSILAVSKTGFVMGSRRQFTVETTRNIESQTNVIVASFRKAFSPVETPSTTISTVSIGYNYTS